MLLQILGAVGALLGLTLLAVFLPGWALTGSARTALRGWVEWCGGLAFVMVPAGLVGAAWAWLEFMGMV